MWSQLNDYVLSLYTRLKINKDEGQALVEYTLILALVSVVSIGVLTLLGEDIKTKLEAVIGAL
jgi:Flp pilus assembly pilin Flp